MRRGIAGSVLILLVAGVCPGQQFQLPAHYIAIDLPGGVASENLFIRYILAGEEVGGQVQPHAGVSAYIISTTRGDGSAAGIKALIYAPGCAIQTLDVPASNSDNPRHSFLCRPLGSIAITGRLVQPERLSGHEMRLQASYIARWAQPFPGLANGIVSIPIGDVASLPADYRFRLSVPDFARDPPAGARDRAGEIRIRAIDKNSGQDVGQLIPIGQQTLKTRMGGLKIQSEYPAEIVFAPCALNRLPALIDSEGFAHRDFVDPCDR